MIEMHKPTPLRRALWERGETAKSLAKRTKIYESAMSGYVNGRTPRRPRRLVIARALDKKAEELWPNA